MHLLEKIEGHFDTRQVVLSVSHFDYEFVEFVIVSAVKTGSTNVSDNVILPPTVSDDGAGVSFVNTDCVHR
jgi:hypothetical protein